MKRTLIAFLLTFVLCGKSFAKENIIYLRCVDGTDIDIDLREKQLWDGYNQYEIYDLQEIMLMAKTINKDREIIINRFTGDVVGFPITNGKRDLKNKETNICEKVDKMF